MDVGETEIEAVGAGLVSEHEAFVPPLEPLHIQVQDEVPLTLLPLVPVLHP
jgi:hypothetical protein